MQATVLVSRSFVFDPKAQPELLDELRALRERGFDVYGNVDLDGQREEPIVGALTKVSSVTRSPVVAELDELASLGLSLCDIARLSGTSREQVRRWKRGFVPSVRYAAELHQLLARARKLPKGSTRLRDESRGIAAAAARSRKLEKSDGKQTLSLTDDQILEVAVLRENGETIDSIAARFGVCAGTVSRAIRVFAS